MRVVFFHEMIESLGLEYLSAALRARGHETELVFSPRLLDNHALTYPRLDRLLGTDPGRLLERIARRRPGLVGFSLNVATWPSSLRLIRAVKEKLGVPVVVGGALATSVPEAVLGRSACDFLIIGEAEEAFADLADALERGKDPSAIPNVWSRRGGGLARGASRPLEEDIDRIPLPDRDLFAREGHLFGLILASRGCPHSCSFCASGGTLARFAPNRAKWFRVRKPEEVVREAAAAKRRYRLPFFHFGDDVFPLQRSWLAEFSPRWRGEVGLPFDINAAPSGLTDGQADLLGEAGCVQVSIGLQSAEPRVAEGVMNRRFRRELAANMVPRLRARGITALVDMMFGSPGESGEQMLESAEWAVKNLEGAEFHSFLYVPLPGTPLERAAVEKGLLPADWWEKSQDSKQSKYGETPLRGPDQWLARNLFILLPLLGRLPALLRPPVRWAGARPLSPFLRMLGPLSLSGLDRSSARTYLRMYRNILPSLLAERIAGDGGAGT